MAKYTPEEIKARIARHTMWYHRMEVAPGIITPGVNYSYDILEKLQLPQDCTGMRVLDIGARDGFFSFILEQRGASEVIAIDHDPVERTGFPILADILNSKVKYYNENVYDLTPEKYGHFDIVLCLGLLYHLRNPLLALEAVRSVCRNELYVESHVIEEKFLRKDGTVGRLAAVSPELLDVPIMRFYPRSEMHNDFSNWWGFNATCLEKLVESANFSVISRTIAGSRGIVKVRVSDDRELRLWTARERGYTTSPRRMDGGEPVRKKNAKASSGEALVTVHGVTNPETMPEELLAASLNSPTVGARFTVYGMKISGWIVGRTAPVAVIEVYHEGQLLRRIPVKQSQPRVKEQFPSLEWAGTSGFWAWIGVVGLGPTFELQLRAVFDDGRSVPFRTIHATHEPIKSAHQPKLHPLMITSIGRTGTTWLMRLMAEHPRVVANRLYPYETRAGFYWAHLLKVLSEPADYADSAHTDTFQQELGWVGHNPFNVHDLTGDPEDQESASHWLGRDYVESLAGFCQQSVDDFYQRIAHRNGQTDPLYVVEKYQPGAKAIWVNWELYPQAKEIILVRDFRDMFCSMQAFNAQRGYANFGRERLEDERSFFEHIKSVTRHLLETWKSRRDQALLLRYENLILRPQATLASVLGYLGLDSSPAVIDAMLAAASSDTPELAQHRTATDPRASIGRWRTDGDEAHRQMLREAFDGLLKEFGYVMKPDGSLDIDQMHTTLRELLPESATVVVVSNGDERLLESTGRTAWHFPRTPEGWYAGYHPADSREAISQLESLKSIGGTHLLVPHTSFWWFDYYREFKAYLDAHYRSLVANGSCVVYDLSSM